jgi:hypothetical protein
MRLVFFTLIGLCACAQTLEKPTNFLVKLSDPIGGKLSKAGQKIGAVIISPEIFLGGRFEGQVKQAAPGKVMVEFTQIKYKSRTIPVTTVTTDCVNSIGHPLVDEKERPITVERGVLTSKTPDFLVDEGAELKLQVTPAGR